MAALMRIFSRRRNVKAPDKTDFSTPGLTLPPPKVSKNSLQCKIVLLDGTDLFVDLPVSILHYCSLIIRIVRHYIILFCDAVTVESYWRRFILESFSSS